jgi:hypothetical protein
MSYTAIVRKANNLVFSNGEIREVKSQWSNLVMNYLSSKLNEADQEGDVGEMIQDFDYDVNAVRELINQQNRLKVTFKIPIGIFNTDEFVEWANSDEGRVAGLGDWYTVVSCQAPVFLNNGGKRRSSKRRSSTKKRSSGGKRRSSKKRSSHRRRF